MRIVEAGEVEEGVFFLEKRTPAIRPPCRTGSTMRMVNTCGPRAPLYKTSCGRANRGHHEGGQPIVAYPAVGEEIPTGNSAIHTKRGAIPRKLAGITSNDPSAGWRESQITGRI